MAGFEDQLFGFGDMRRQRIIQIYRDYDVDPNIQPDGTFLPNRLEALVNDPTVSFDTIRRAAIAANSNGFTNKQMQDISQAAMPVTLSNPFKYIDTSHLSPGELELGDDSGFPEVTIADDNLGDVAQTNYQEGGDAVYTDAAGMPAEGDQLTNPALGKESVALPENQAETPTVEPGTPPLGDGGTGTPNTDTAGNANA